MAAIKICTFVGKKRQMILYKVLYKNYYLRKGELLGFLPERRKDSRGKNPSESAMKWARLIFKDFVRDKHAIFVATKELTEVNKRPPNLIR